MKSYFLKFSPRPISGVGKKNKSNNLLLYTLLFLFLKWQPLNAQWSTVPEKRQKSLLEYELELENGGIMAQNSLKHITYKNAQYQGLSFKIGWKQTDSNRLYNRIYNYPTYGIGFYSGTFNDHILGEPFALFGFIKVPFRRAPNSRWLNEYRIGLGLTGNFKPFDKSSNPFNLVIGSAYNVYIDLGFKTNYQLTSTLKMGAGVSFRHFSNGALSLPNKGINLLPLSLSVNYTPKDERMEQSNVQIEPVPKSWVYDLSIGAGLKQMEIERTELFPKFTLAFYTSRPVSHKWRMGFGGELFYSTSGSDSQLHDTSPEKLGNLVSGGPSFYLVHVLNPKLLLNGNIGYYLHRNYANGEISDIFLRAGFRYYVFKNINLGASIKAHMGKADYIEWTAGYTFGH